MARASTSTEQELRYGILRLKISDGNSVYRYTSNDVGTILKGRLREEKLTEDEGIFAIDPTTEEETCILVKLLKKEKKIQTASKLHPKRILLVPYLCNSDEHDHWVGVVVRFENNEVQRIQYFDSLVGTINEKLRRCVEGAYGENVVIKQVKGKLYRTKEKDDFAFCGPCMIENLINAAKQLTSPEIIRKHTPFMSRTFPRSEYKARYVGTSAFKMEDPEFWNSYFRSTAPGGGGNRLFKEFKKSDSIFVNPNTNSNRTIRTAGTGAFKSPWMHPEYREIFKLTPISLDYSSTNIYKFLYDELLKYKLSVCGIVVSKCEGITDKVINVYYANDYPCVMVQLRDDFQNTIEGEIRSLYKIIVAYFTAITNELACDKQVPIELVNRASFGHNCPSVAETGTSFRINVGIVPKIYAQVIADSLHYLNEHFVSLLINEDPSKRFKLKSSRPEDEVEWLEEHNNSIEKYNQEKQRTMKKIDPTKVDQWNLDDDLFSVLVKKGDSGGHKVSLQITRTNKYIDLLTDYVKEALDKRGSLAEPLRKILKKLRYSKEGVSLEVKDEEFHTEMTSFSDDEHTDIKNDESSFWKIIKSIHNVFEKQDIKILYDYIANTKIRGLYSALETANLEFIKNSSYKNSECGYGSDSDFEGSTEDVETKFYSKKIIVPTGMRAINYAQLLSIYLARTKRSYTKYMYYETKEAIKYVKDVLKELEFDQTEIRTSKQKTIRYIDLTHCAAEGPDSEVPQLSAEEYEQVIVFDCTSATTKRICEAIKLINKVPVLILVSSGIKNEQLGADMNPYGTIRIIAQDKCVLRELYCIAIYALLSGKEILPKELHCIRRAYKDAGAVVTSAELFKDERDEKRNEADSFYVENFNFGDKVRKIIDLFYKNSHREQLDDLIEIYGLPITEIVDWTSETFVDKVEFLCSSETQRFVGYFYDMESNYFEKVDVFREVVDEYDDDPELIKKLISDVSYDYHQELFDDKRIDDVIDDYKSKRQKLFNQLWNEGFSIEEADRKLDDTNILDMMIKELRENENPFSDYDSGSDSYDEADSDDENELSDSGSYDEADSDEENGLSTVDDESQSCN